MRVASVAADSLRSLDGAELTLDPHLTLRGLRVVWERNRP